MGLAFALLNLAMAAAQFVLLARSVRARRVMIATTKRLEDRIERFDALAAEYPGHGAA